jgi:transcriptional regulator with PAS, ATPase and Fis domain
MPRRTGNQTDATSRHQEASPRRHPFLIVVGSAQGIEPQVADPLYRIGESLLIGRDSRDADPGDGRAWRPADRLVSSAHARIVRGPKGLEIRDLDSTNGTFVNGRRVSGTAPVADGDLIFVGAHAAILRVISDQQLAAIHEDQKCPLAPVVTSSPGLAMVCRKLRTLATSDLEILLTGETGVGKEVFAEAIHQASGREGPFVAINCAAIPRELVESELFGYARGAHSQASRSKAGLLLEAARGTLFLDEIGEMSGDAQAKLLRFLQTRSFTPLGAVSPTRVDVRIVAATNRAVASGGAFGLRPDLAARLGAQPLTLPALRNRLEDLGRLTAHFLRCGQSLAFDVAAFRALCLHRWPGNIRELEKVLREAQLLARDAEEIGIDHLPEALNPGLPANLSTTVRTRRRASPTREELEQLLETHQGNVAEVARSLDRQWAVVWHSIVRYGIEVEKFRRTSGTSN